MRKRPKASNCPDSGIGGVSGSVKPSPELVAAAAVALPPLSDGAAIGPEVTVVGVDVVAAASFALGGLSIFIVRGTWKARSPSRSTPPIAA